MEFQKCLFSVAGDLVLLRLSFGTGALRLDAVISQLFGTIHCLQFFLSKKREHGIHFLEDLIRADLKCCTALIRSLEALLQSTVDIKLHQLSICHTKQ